MKDSPVAREGAEAIPTDHFDLHIGVVVLISFRCDTESALREVACFGLSARVIMILRFLLVSLASESVPGIVCVKK